MQPLLFIGLGGAGGKTIRAIKQELLKQIQMFGWANKIPEAWQFLHIDFAVDGLEFPAPMLAQNETHLILPRGTTFNDTSKILESAGSFSELQEMLAGWVEPGLAVNINSSPSQERRKGRQGFMAGAGGTHTAISKSIGRMSSPQAESELQMISKKSGVSTNTTPHVLIFSSLVGRTGSGILLDVVEMLKPNLYFNQLTTFLFTQDVFESLGISNGLGSKNTLGAINEISASVNRGPSEETRLLYQKLGFGGDFGFQDRKDGSLRIILIGSRNSSGIDLALGGYSSGMNQVFLSIGKSLAGIVTDDKVSDEFLTKFAYAREMGEPQDLSSLSPESKRSPLHAASSIGMSKLTVGTELLIDYVADALTRAQVIRLLWPKLGGAAQLPRVDESVSGLIEKKSIEHWPRFLKKTGLNERQNQITDKLIPSEWQNQSRAIAVNLVETCISVRGITLEQLCQRVTKQLQSEYSHHLNKFRVQINENAKQWIIDIQKTMANVIEEEVLNSGILVTTSLLEMLSSELEMTVQELGAERNSISGAIKNFIPQELERRVSSFIEDPSRVSVTNSELLDAISDYAVRFIYLGVKEDLLDVARDLTQDFQKAFLSPIIAGLKKSGDLLEWGASHNGDDKLHTLPTWGTGKIPVDYRGLPNERFLIDVSDFENIFESCFTENSTSAFERSIRQSLLGGHETDSTAANLSLKWLEVKNSWVSENHKLRALEEKPSDAGWKFEFNISDLRLHNRRWLWLESSPLRKKLTLSIKSYIEDCKSPSEKYSRESRFIQELDALLASALPLTTFNFECEDYLVNYNGEKPISRVLYSISKIPFDTNSKLGSECLKLFNSYGVNVFKSFDWHHYSFDQNPNTSAIYALSSTYNSLPLWAFKSLTSPVLHMAAIARCDDSSWENFWEGRRSRPLKEAIPFESQIRQSIITGWFVSRLFGLSKLKKEPEQTREGVGRSVEIWNPTLQIPDWSTFPSPLLATHRRDMQHEYWVLPQLLTSAGLAFAMFGETGNPSHLYGYRLLKYLGREVTTFEHRDTWDGNGVGDLLPNGSRSQSSYIQKWLETGVTHAPSPKLLPALVESLKENSDRKSALIKTLQQTRAQYSEAWKRCETLKWYELPETWELRKEIDLALADIEDYVSRISPIKNTSI